MLRGREFTAAEELSPTAPRVAIIDDRLAAVLFQNEDPIGQVIRLARQGDADPAANSEPMVVVGVAPSIREEVIDRAPLAHVYVPWGRHYRAGMHLHIRGAAAGDAALSSLMAAVRKELRAADAALPVLDVTSLQRFHDRSLVLWGVRAGGQMLTVFGVLALALAVVGVYGVKAYVVSQRTREIGIRIALGATAGDVRSLLLKEALVLTTAGIVLGLPVALLLGRALGSILFSVGATDPVIFIGAPAVLAGASMLASYLPSRRAVRIEPTTALRA
jgi:putative ABC transport system permease protein